MRRNLIRIGGMILLLTLLTARVIFADIDVAKIAKEATPGIVLIMVYDENSQLLALGSGFFVNSEGEIATNYHVIEGGVKVVVKTMENKQYDVKGIVAYDLDRDLAILKIDAKTPKTLAFGNSEIVNVGDRIVAIGNAMGLECSVSEGIISGVREIDETLSVFQITAPISPGSSGGPLLNEKAEVIGITTASVIEAQNINFAIPVKYLAKLSESKGEIKPLQQISSQKIKQYSEIKNKNFVRVIDSSLALNGLDKYDFFDISIFNGHEFAIKNIKLIIIYYKSDAQLPMTYQAIEIKDTIPSMLSIGKHIKTPYDFPTDFAFAFLTENPKLLQGYRAGFRILDYDILPTSQGEIEFEKW